MLYVVCWLVSIIPLSATTASRNDRSNNAGPGLSQQLRGKCPHNTTEAAPAVLRWASEQAHLLIPLHSRSLCSFNGVDNGFLRFTYVRVPHDAMLMRFAKVSEDGQYTPPPPDNQKASYATMVYVRATIVRDAGDFLGRAATIATR